MIHGEQAAKLLGAFTVFAEDTDTGVTLVTGELLEVLELQEQPLEDLVTILSHGRPVHELSPGGRSSAMLPLIALSDEVPLIIDQPEDNLDNRMVGRLFVDALAVSAASLLERLAAALHDLYDRVDDLGPAL